MFFKYAENVLEELSNDCLLKSFACKDEEMAGIYKGLSDKIQSVIDKLRVEEQSQAAQKEHE